MVPFLERLINGIIQDVVGCVWLLSLCKMLLRVTHVAVCQFIPSCCWIHSIEWTYRNFCDCSLVSDIALRSNSEYMSYNHLLVDLFVDLFSFLLGKFLRVELMGCVINIRSVFQETADPFFKVAIWFYILTSKVWECSGSSISSSILDMVFLFKFSNPARCTMRLTLVLICISLILNSVEHILMNWVVISSLERCLFSLFLPIFNCCYFLSDYCQSSLYILHTSPLSGIIGKHQANISHL